MNKLKDNYNTKEESKIEDKGIKEAVKERFAATVIKSSSRGCSRKAEYLDADFIQTAGKVAGYSDQELKSVPAGANLGQRAVLMAALEAVEEMKIPGSIKHLPFEWTGTEKEAQAQPPEPPPIVGYLKWHPWELPRLFSRDVPRES